MTADPVLVEATRGGVVESVHRGAFVVADAAGRIVAQGGDVERPVFPRSAVKLVQALPLVESGAADALKLDNRLLAMACSSHSGEPAHVDAARTMLAAGGMEPHALECGTHWPFFKQPILIEFARTGAEPGPLHNNCSGKHSGLLCVCAHMGLEAGGYTSPDHAAMRMVRDVLQEVTEYPHGDGNMGVDGCGYPNWAVPLQNLATAYARLGTGEGLSRSRAAAARRLAAATMAEPWHVAGTDRFDTTAMQAADFKAHVKTGAEGVYCAMLPSEGLGIALKIADGATRASEIAIAALLGAHLEGEAGDTLSRMARRTLRNWAGDEVGELRATETLST